MSSVNGIDKFKEYFENYSDAYVIIGGTATNIFLEEAGLNIRVTKDIDMILICENLSCDFGKSFWKFIKDGNYDAYKSKDDKKHYYRFINNNNVYYPKMIELFSKKQKLEEYNKSIFTPLKIDEEISSLSAIILDDDYYNFLLKGKRTVNGLSVLEPLYLIAFKAKAHVDLTNKKKNNVFVNEHDSKKHKNDIFRLLQLVRSDAKCDVPEEVRKDLKDFLSLINKENTAVEALTNDALNFDDAVDLIRRVYNL